MGRFETRLSEKDVLIGNFGIDLDEFYEKQVALVIASGLSTEQWAVRARSYLLHGPDKYFNDFGQTGTIPEEWQANRGPAPDRALLHLLSTQEIAYDPVERCGNLRNFVLGALKKGIPPIPNIEMVKKCALDRYGSEEVADMLVPVKTSRIWEVGRHVGVITVVDCFRGSVDLHPSKNPEKFSLFVAEV